MSSNNPSVPAYGVYTSQLIRYAHCGSIIVTFYLLQGYKVDRLSNTLKKFYVKHIDLVGQYNGNVCQMIADSIS